MPHRLARWLFALAALAAVALAAGLSPALTPRAIPAQAPPPAAAFKAEDVRRGRQLAAIGDCASCHTMRGGSSYAGGVALQTPFGVIHGTNITPEPQTGIGRWPLEAFRRALREGISRDGHHLYPAFPYDHFTRLTDADIAALYAFVMTRDPVQAPAPKNDLMFPFGFRPLVAAWNLLYLHEGPQPANGDAPQERGRYLVDALAHCAACHSPRNVLGAERKDRFLAGGEAEGWHASALDQAAESPVPWTAEVLASYLRTGLVPDHAMTAGPMQDVVRGLSQADEKDVAAIAAYITGRMGPADDARRTREANARKRSQAPLAAARPATAGGDDDARLALGRSVYEASCASCHDVGRGVSSNTALQLPLAVALHMPDPRNLLHIVRKGIQPVDGAPGRVMPPFEGNLSDEQLTALAVWLRRQATDAPPWQDVAKAVTETGKER